MTLTNRISPLWGPALLIALSLIIAGYFIGNMHKTAKEYDRSVEVKGLSEREVAADLAVWPVTITLTGNELSTLRKDIENQKQELMDFFKRMGFQQDELSQGVLNINDVRANPYNNPNQNTDYRYLATAEFAIRTSDIARLQSALAASPELLEKGVLLGSKNSWRPIEYIFTGLNELKPSMIEEATKNAREVAERFARDSEAKVGEIRQARQGLFSISDRDENTPQIKVVRVVSTLTFQLEN